MSEGIEAVKIFSIGVETDIPLTHQKIDPLRKEPVELLVTHCTTAALMPSSDPNLRPFISVSWWPNTWKAQCDKSGTYGGWSNTFQRIAGRVLYSTGHVGTEIVVQRYDGVTGDGPTPSSGQCSVSCAILATWGRTLSCNTTMAAQRSRSVTQWRCDVRVHKIQS